MKILITGLPGSGKTTLLRTCIPYIRNPFWIITDQILDNGIRVGFRANAVNGDSALIAHKAALAPLITVGNYAVDVAAIDDVFTKNIKHALLNQQPLLIDEIGRMQILSTAFMEVVRQAFAGENDILASIPVGEGWADEFINNPDVLVLTLTKNNRQALAKALQAIIISKDSYLKLSQQQQCAASELTQVYSRDQQFIQIEKLYSHAIRYVTLGRVAEVYGGGYIVEGDHGDHTVTDAVSTWVCDCDLFNGRGQYQAAAGICSHIQAVKLFAMGSASIVD